MDNNNYHHFTDCGLGDVYLVNGFHKVVVEGREEVIIDDEDGLYRAIGRRICEKSFVNGDEFAFLRKQMKMSQSRCGAVFGVSDQMVYLWEKRSAIPRQATAVMKALYLDYIKGTYRMISLLMADETPRPAETHFEYRGEWNRMAA